MSAHGTPARATAGCTCQDCVEATISPTRDRLLDLLGLVYGPVYVAGCLLRLLIRLLAPPRRLYGPWRRWRHGLPERLHASRIKPTTDCMPANGITAYDQARGGL